MSWIIKKELITATSIYNEKGESIATVQAEEHAQLIAAAPEMLEALVILLREYEKLFNSQRRMLAVESDATYSFAALTIKKARGAK